MRNDACRYLLAPTISYTQRLEERVRELEALVEGLKARDDHGGGDLELKRESSGRSDFDAAEIGISRDDGGVSPDERSRGPPLSAGGFDGLKRDEKGGITYHGATSFFQLPAPASFGDGGLRLDSELAGWGGERKDRLVSNAWQQRAMETFSETPVSFSFWSHKHRTGQNQGRV